MSQHIKFWKNFKSVTPSRPKIREKKVQLQTQEEHASFALSMDGGVGDGSAMSKDFSTGSASRTGQPPNGQRQSDNKTNDGRRRNRPGRAEREKHRRREPTDASASTIIPLNLNPSASEFVPQRTMSSVIVASERVNPERRPPSESRSNKGRPRGGRSKKLDQHQMKDKGKENVVDDSSSQGTAAQRHRRNPNARPRLRPTVQAEVLKESEDLMVRMTEALNKGDYDCSICTDRVRSSHFLTNIR